jgi:DNA-binding CsgD family transcriptional regulator/tetratricopeptide (TPR) repeat protein
VLTAALDGAARGRGSVHFILGEGGVGKTRLATVIADVAASKGFSRVIGRAYAVETGIPYALFADGFLPVLRALPPATLQVLARGSTAELATLFPALRGEGLAPREFADDELKPRLLDAFSRFVHQLAQREPQLIILENLHWADRSSLELLHIVARGASAHRLMLLCTYDDTRRDANPTLKATEQSLRSLDALRTHALLPFTPGETRELIQQRFDIDEATVAQFAGRIHDRTRGNAFFIQETIETLLADGRVHRVNGHWTGWSVGEIAMPRSVRDAITLRLERLSEDAQQVATMAAVVGVQVAHPLLEALTSLEPSRVLAAIDELRRERVLTEIDADGEVAYEFPHPLIREVLYVTLSRVRARALHARIADTLEHRIGEDALAHAGALAVHFRRAESSVQAPRAFRYLVAAGSSALDRGSNHEALDMLDAARVIIGDAGATDADIERVHDLLARAKQRVGDYASATDLWNLAVASATSRGDVSCVSSYERRLGVAAFLTGRYDDAIAHFDRGLIAAAGDDAGTALLRLARSAVLLDTTRGDEADADIRSALEIAERIGDPSLLSRAHHAVQMLALWRGPAEAARENGAKALAFAKLAGDRAAEWNAEWAMAVHCGLTGDVPGTAKHIAAATALADELNSPVQRMWTLEAAIEYRTSLGEWKEAITLADRTIADARAFSQYALLPRLLVWSSIIRFGRGEIEVGREHMEEAWRLAGAHRVGSGAHVNIHTVAPAHVSRASWHLARREFREALEVAEAGIAIVDKSGYTAWAVHRLMPIAGEAALYLKDFERATKYGTRLRDESIRLSHPLGLAWADACFAIMRLLQGHQRESIPMLESAAQALEAIPFVDYAARVRRVLADAYYESGDTDKAVRELRKIHEIFAHLGAQPALDHVREKFRQLGIRPPARSAAEGAGSLTAREVEIARLVAGRLSNKEIATALQISSRTVGTHLSNIFGKLSVDSRGELTDFVREGGLDS